jgi:hypothetical protein
LLFDLVSHLQSDFHLFSWRKLQPSAHYDRGLESRYFQLINGHPRRPRKVL